ncbi:MAG: hypothetical protein WCI17_06760 [bacterium]
MPDIVQEGCETHQAALILVEAQSFGHESGKMGDSECMVKTGMNSPRINQRGHGKLTDAAQPLDWYRINEVTLLVAKRHEAVNRVSYSDFCH